MWSIKHTIILGGAILVAVAIGLIAPGTSEAQASTVWRSMASGGVTYTVPDGWTQHDPFTSRTRYYIGHDWLPESMPDHMHVAVLVSHAAHGQVFLVRGDRDEIMQEMEIESQLTKLQQHPLVKYEDEQTAQTADGTTVRCLVAHMGEGLLAGDSVTYVMAFADIGTDLFVVNAGGLTGRFDPQDVLDLIASLRFEPAVAGRLFFSPISPRSIESRHDNIRMCLGNDRIVATRFVSAAYDVVPFLLLAGGKE